MKNQSFVEPMHYVNGVVIMKKMIAIVLALLCLFNVFALSAYAKTDNSVYKMICTGTGYKNSNTKMYNQTMTEKYVEVSNNKTLQIRPYTSTSTNNGHGLKQYVRFTVWIYDINTGKRIVNVVCSNNSFITWKNTTGKTVHLSVQVRPYIAQSAWNKYGYTTINAYITSTQYRFTYNNNYLK